MFTGLLGIQFLGLFPAYQLQAMCLFRKKFHTPEALATITSQPEWRTLAGYPGAPGTNDGPGIAARFSQSSSKMGVASDSGGNVYVADTGNHTIRKINPAGLVTTLAGQPGIPGYQNGVGTAALFNEPSGLAVAASGDLFVADSGNSVIRRISATGLTSTYAGKPNQAGYKDGGIGVALFNSPLSLALDTNGTLYVADTGNSVVRKISPTGEVTTLAGQPGSHGDLDGFGTNALFDVPWGLAIDAQGNVFVTQSGVDSGSGALRKISPAGEVSTLPWSVAPVGNLTAPIGVAIAADGTIYVADSVGTVHKVSAKGDISTAGGSNPGRFGNLQFADGLAPFARFYGPADIALDGHGHLLLADAGSGTVRRGSLQTENRPQFLSQPSSQKVQQGASSTLSVEVQSLTPVSYQWLVNGTILPGATNASLALPNVTAANAGEYRVAVSDGVGYFLSSPAALDVTPVQSGSPLDHWHLLASLAVKQLFGLTYGNGRYVVVGDSGVVSSPDTVEWTKTAPMTTESLNSVAFGNGRFVAVGTGGVVLTSVDGLAWEARSLTPEGSPKLDGVTFNQGVFVAVSGDVNGSIWTSTDGFQWTNRVLDFDDSFMAVTAGGGRFVTVGNTILTSTNGMDWEPANIPSELAGQDILLTHLAYGNGMFLATEAGQSNQCQGVHGRVFASATGMHWYEVTPTNGLMLSGVVYGNGQFVAIDAASGGISISSNGTDWTLPVPILDGDQVFSAPSIAFGGGLFVLAGPQATIGISSNATSWTFPWQRGALPSFPSTLLAVNGSYLAAGSGIDTSNDGVNWRPLLRTNWWISCLAYGNGALVAIGEGSYPILTSTDGGQHWTDCTPRIGAYPGLWLYHVAFVNEAFVAVGNVADTNSHNAGYILRSPDGVHWQPVPIQGLDTVRDLAYGDGRYVALGYKASAWSILESSDATSWRITTTFTNLTLAGVAFGNHCFVVGLAGAATGALTSQAEGQWRQWDIPGQGWVSSVAFGNGFFLAPTSAGDFSSPDGSVWTRLFGPGLGYGFVEAGEGVLLALGDSGLYRSAPIERLLDPRIGPNGQVEWTVAGAPHVDYRVEFSEDLQTWQTLTNVTNAAAAQPFTDPGAANRRSRFYRVRLLP